MAKTNTKNVEIGTAQLLLRLLSPQSLFLTCFVRLQLGPGNTSLLLGSRDVLEEELAVLSQGVFPPCTCGVWPLGAFGTLWLTPSRRAGTSSGIHPPVMFPNTPRGFPEVSPAPQRGNFLGSFRGSPGGSLCSSHTHRVVSCPSAQDSASPQTSMPSTATLSLLDRVSALQGSPRPNLPLPWVLCPCR